jgi:hypothetical protein
VTTQLLSRRDLLLLEPPPRPLLTDRWEALGGRLAPVADAMVELAEVTLGQRVLAAAAGNQALVKAVERRGAIVERSESVRFGWPDAAFDAVLGFFSVTSFAKPRAVAEELKRVARPGAPIVLATWEGQPWARYETAHRHFFGFPELDVTDHALPESGMAYALVFARKPQG